MQMDVKKVIALLDVLEQRARSTMKTDRANVSEFVDHLRAAKEILERDPERVDEYIRHLGVSA